MKQSIPTPPTQKEITTLSQKENRKAIPKFLIILLISAVIGFVSGIGAAVARDHGFYSLPAFLDYFWNVSAPWYIPVFSVTLLLPSFLLTLGQKARISALKEEEEAVQKKIDRRLSISLLLTSLYIIGMFVSIAVVLSLEASSETFNFHLLLIWVIELVFGFVLAVYQQNKAVTLTKYLYPGKHGSVLDMHFNKVWLESCDEREKMLIYKAAYTAHMTVSTVYPFLFLLIAFGSIPFQYGPLPSWIVLLLWLIQVLSYFLACMHEENKINE